jgi:hypothetical protein
MATKIGAQRPFKKTALSPVFQRFFPIYVNATCLTYGAGHQRYKWGVFSRKSTMLLIASESSKNTRTLVDLARELSLTLTYFGSNATHNQLREGQSRRIVLLSDADIS